MVRRVECRLQPVAALLVALSTGCASPDGGIGQCRAEVAVSLGAGRTDSELMCDIRVGEPERPAGPRKDTR